MSFAMPSQQRGDIEHCPSDLPIGLLLSELRHIKAFQHTIRDTYHSMYDSDCSNSCHTQLQHSEWNDALLQYTIHADSKQMIALQLSTHNALPQNITETSSCKTCKRTLQSSRAGRVTESRAGRVTESLPQLHEEGRPAVEHRLSRLLPDHTSNIQL